MTNKRSFKSYVCRPGVGRRPYLLHPPAVVVVSDPPPGVVAVDAGGGGAGVLRAAAGAALNVPGIAASLLLCVRVDEVDLTVESRFQKALHDKYR